MSIEYHILGGAGRDNALLVYIHTGQENYRLLFDCGEGTLAALPFAEIQRIDRLLFSHLHMDHIGGFDSYFRCAYNRTLKPNIIWGPPESARILHHRFQGFLWNLCQDREVSWQVCDVSPEQIACTRFELSEAFSRAYPDGERPFNGILIETDDFTVEAAHMEHLTPVLAFIVREKPRQNIDPSRMMELGLRPGPWLREVKSPAPGQTHVEVEGVPFAIEELRAAMLAEFTGDSIAYLTDFILDEDAFARLLPLLQGCKTIVCESAYRHVDLELAQRNYHITAVQAAELARQANAGKLILIHLSDRYPPEEWPELLNEAREVFPETYFSRTWGIDG